jgi:hypothetical protein
MCVLHLQGLRTSSLPGSSTVAELSAEAHSPTAAAEQEQSPTGPAQPFRRQLLECTRKLTLAYWRMPAYNLLRLLMTVACAIVSDDNRQWPFLRVANNDKLESCAQPKYCWHFPVCQFVHCCCSFEAGCAGLPHALQFVLKPIAVSASAGVWQHVLQSG